MTLPAIKIPLSIGRITSTNVFLNIVKHPRLYSTLNALGVNPFLKSEKIKKDGTILGIGNPMMEHTLLSRSETEEELIHQKYELNKSDRYFLNLSHRQNCERLISAEFKESNLVERLDLDSLNFEGELPPCVRVPGGPTLNSIRVANWLLAGKGKCAFIGALGEDDEADLLRSNIEKLGISPNFQTISNYNTGRHLSLASTKNHTFFTDIGAADQLTEDFIETEACKKNVSDASLVYIGGYMWPSNQNLIHKIATLCSTSEQRLIMNLHASFLCSYFANPDHQYVMSAVDYLFGNSIEALEFAKQMAVLSPEKKIRTKFEEFLHLPVLTTDSLERLAIFVSNSIKRNPAQQRVVIFTQGSRGPVIVCRGDVIRRYVVQPEKPDLMADNIGCGDAFVGGFMAQLAVGGNLEQAIQCAFYAAKVVLRHFGCTFPAQPHVGVLKTSSSDQDYLTNTVSSS